MSHAERIARAFHETYERFAPSFGYDTRPASQVEWEKVPDANRGLMVAVVESLLAREVIIAGGVPENPVGVFVPSQPDAVEDA